MSLQVCSYCGLSCRQLQDFSTHPQNVPLSLSLSSATAATIKGKPKPAFATPQRPLRNSKSSHQLKDSCAGVQGNRSFGERPRSPPLATVVQPKEEDRTARQEGFQSELQKKFQMRAIKAAETASERDSDSTSSNGQANPAAAEAATKTDTTSLCETAQPDFSAGLKFKELARMFSATTIQETAVQPKRKHREEEKHSQVKPLALRPSEATTAQETAVQPKEKDTEDPKLPQNVPDSTSATAQMNPASAETTSEEDPNMDFSNMKLASSVKDLARMFSAATTQETAVGPKKGKHGEEQKVKPLAQKLSTTTAQETAVHRKEKDEEVQNLTKVRSDRITAKHKIQMTEQKVPQGRSSVKASQPFQGSLEAEWLEINSVISDVVKVAEAAKQNSIYLSMYTLRTTTSTMVEQIQQKLEQLSALEIKWMSKFSVNVKLDPTTAYRCLVSADGKKVSSGEKNQEAPGGFGSVLGFNNLTSGKSYWEVVVSNKTGWKLGVARGDANHKGTLSLNPDKGYWITEYYKNKYAALTAPPVGLSLKEKPQKVGVFMDYEEGVVSFYDVTNQCQIYAFTECSFTGEIYPYLSLHLKEDGERSDPLIVSTLKAQ